MDDFNGVYTIRFVGFPHLIEVDIDHSVRDIYGHPIYVVTKDETIYNWSNILMMKKKG